LLARVFNISRAGVRRSLLIGATVSFGVLAQFYCADIERYQLSVLGNAQYFLGGFLLCELYLATVRLPGPTLYVLDLTAVIALLTLVYSESPTIELLFPLGALLVFYAGLRGVLLPRFFGLTVVSIAGGMCYSVYLTHGTVLAAIGTVWSKVALGSVPLVAQQLLLIGVCAAAVYGVGTLYYLAIERPCMDPRWPGKLRLYLVRMVQSPEDMKCHRLM
jgi:peptidoglycan/LPS O-acetylase OafA/YrhL